MRSSPAPDIGPVYPATAVDGLWIYQTGILGEPPLATGEGEKMNPMRRLVYPVGGLIDLPISIVTDTVLLPYDLYKLSKTNDEKEGTIEPGC